MIIEQQLHTLITAAFRFVVALDGIPLGAFTECALPTIEWSIEEVKEKAGAEHLRPPTPWPKEIQQNNLENGVAVAPDLHLWYLKTMHEDFSRKRVTVTLLNALFIPVVVLNIEDALPVKWTGPQLKSDDNTVAIQTLELVCGEITLV